MSTTPGTRRISRSSAAASSWRRDPAVEDPVAVVGDERRRAVSRSRGWQPRHGAGGRRGPRERHDLYRQAAPGAEARHELLGGDEDDLAPRGGGDDPLPRERPAVALDEVELRVDLVGAVDRDVERSAGQLGDGRGRAIRERRDRPRGGDPRTPSPWPPRRPAPGRRLPRPGRSRARRGRCGPPSRTSATAWTARQARSSGRGAGSGLGGAPTRPGLLGIAGGPSQTSPAGLA